MPLPCISARLIRNSGEQKKRESIPMGRDCPLATSALLQLDVQRLFHLLEFALEALNLFRHIQPGLQVGKTVCHQAAQLFLSIVYALNNLFSVTASPASK
jgi:hypothetical protein